MEPYPITVDLKTAARITGLGRSLLYSRMQAGDIAFIKVGKRRLILFDTLQNWLVSLQASTSFALPDQPPSCDQGQSACHCSNTEHVSVGEKVE